ncbi:hypothetical protein [Agriterribacter sp.]|uniref:hypothetical protein n=1 Tax=Agriterribacter sp. TaxID=2821509 RepID=UPI002CCCA226|nr:hypothetical protein [Agriterribacter sp.]HRO46258.1 hypothetical protein [Agriterribacter sp.]HRQ18408.1 hypothetical protein [Agriterribacter sp.]
MKYSLPGKNNGLRGPASVFFALLFFISTPSNAQHMADTAMLRLQKTNAVNIYYQALQQQSGLYNGSEYVQYTHLLKEGHPYFDTSVLTNGRVYYDRMVYSNVPMLYDIIKDELIIQHYNKVFLVQLIRSKIDSFYIHGHYFLHLGRDSITEGNIQEGFYDRLYDGKIKLYAKRNKFIQESIPDMAVVRKVYQKDRYFLFRDGTYHDVYTESSILKLLKDERAALKQALKNQKIKFRKNREYAMKLMAEQYDVLNR